MFDGDDVHLTVFTWHNIKSIIPDNNVYTPSTANNGPHKPGYLPLNKFLEYYYGYIACRDLH